MLENCLSLRVVHRKKKNDSLPTHRCMFVFQFFITNNIFIIKTIIITKRNYEPNC